MDDSGPMYRWQQGINATWEAVTEDEQGRLVAISTDRERLHRARKQRLTQSIRRGLIRYLVIALDCSVSALERDYRPSRLEASKQALQKFVGEFFGQNPISQLAIVVSRDRTAEKVSELSGTARTHIDSLGRLYEATDLASLQNTILLALKVLKHIPNYGHRELLIVYNSLSSCDPSDIYATLEQAKAARLRISVISLVAEIFICRQVAEMTGGSFAVALNEEHLMELLQKHTVPPPEIVEASAPAVADFIPMGFPNMAFASYPLFGYAGKQLSAFKEAYRCPRCLTRASDLPTKCTVCSLQLNSSSHIARSYHHLFPAPVYLEYTVRWREAGSVSSRVVVKTEPGDRVNSVGQKRAREDDHAGSAQRDEPLTLKLSKPKEKAWMCAAERVSVTIDEEEDETGDDSAEAKIQNDAKTTRIVLDDEHKHCRGCQRSLVLSVPPPSTTEGVALQCPRCLCLFCLDCDLFVHDVLHNCPGCH